MDYTQVEQVARTYSLRTLQGAQEGHVSLQRGRGFLVEVVPAETEPLYFRQPGWDYSRAIQQILGNPPFPGAELVVALDRRGEVRTAWVLGVLDLDHLSRVLLTHREWSYRASDGAHRITGMALVSQVEG